MKRATLTLFEDDHAALFEPVALTRSVARLRCGLWTHRERWERSFPERDLEVICRGYLRETESVSGEWTTVDERTPKGDVLFAAAALGRPDPATLHAIRDLPSGSAIVAGEHLLAVRASGEIAGRIAGMLREVVGETPFPSPSSADWPRLLEEIGISVRGDDRVRVPRTLVDLMAASGSAIAEDFAAYESALRPPDPTAFPGAHSLAPERMRFGEGVRIDPGAVLDAREGPIVLGPRTRVMANCVLMGPVAAGPDCVFNPAARVMDGVCLGPVCKIGGEVDATVVQEYSNKQHDGFLGHSYLGAWVNLGAATDSSDLKNDYGPVRIVLAGETRDTGSRHVGSLIGDHSKTAIHTSLNTGTVIGVSANVFGVGFPPKEIPSFTWGGGDEIQEYRLEKALRVAVVVTARRNVELGPHGERLFAELHRATAERRAALFGATRL